MYHNLCIHSSVNVLLGRVSKVAVKKQQLKGRQEKKKKKGRQRILKAHEKQNKWNTYSQELQQENMPNTPPSLVGLGYKPCLTRATQIRHGGLFWGGNKDIKEKLTIGRLHSYGVSPLSHLGSTFCDAPCLINPA